MRPIDADVLLKELHESRNQLLGIRNSLYYDDEKKVCDGQLTTFVECCLIVRELPTLTLDDLRPKGRWIDKGVRDWHCSECDEKLRGNGWDGYVYKDLPKFCPDCGADMRGGGEDG